MTGQAQEPSTPRVSPRAPVVLVAEDDATMRRLLAIALGRDGFRVIDVHDGCELEAWIRRCIAHERHVDLVIADQRMPMMTGLEVLARLRQNDWAVPFILITAFSDAATHLEAQRLGVSCVLDKPFDLDDLRAVAHHFALPGDA